MTTFGGVKQMSGTVKELCNNVAEHVARCRKCSSRWRTPPRWGRIAVLAVSVTTTAVGLLAFVQGAYMTEVFRQGNVSVYRVNEQVYRPAG